MTQEPPKSNAVLIIIAIIGVLGTIIASTISVIGSYNVEKLRQETELTRIALVSIVTQGGATQMSMESTISAPTNTLSPDFLNAIHPTYTPYPTYTQSIIPVIPTSTNTPEPNLIFEDNFDEGINPAYWQIYGKWSVANGVPIVVEEYKSERKYNYSAFEYNGVIIFPGTIGMDNIAIDFDLIELLDLDILLSVRDEYNYKRFELANFSGGGSKGLYNFGLASNGDFLEIPQSDIDVYFPKPSRMRLEIRANSIKVFVNNELKYDFKNLPDTVAGAFGFATSRDYPQFDNLKIYQLP